MRERAHLVLRSVFKFEEVVDEIAPTHEHELSQQFDGLECGPFEIEVDPLQLASGEDRHSAATENKNCSVEYAVHEGRIVYADTLLPVLFASDLSHNRLSLKFDERTVADASGESSALKNQQENPA